MSKNINKDNELKKKAKLFNTSSYHLKKLLKDKNRLKKFILKDADIIYDFSHQRIDEDLIKLLSELAKEKEIKEKFFSMLQGDKVNFTEKRPALHTSCRNFSSKSIKVNSDNIIPEIKSIRDEIKKFSKQIRNKKIKGTTGKSFKDIVIIGIGGSILGTEFVFHSLEYLLNNSFKFYFLSNVDIHNFSKISQEINPERTLFIVISKSFKTKETLSNTKLVKSFLKNRNLNLSKHIIHITSKGSPGDIPSKSILKTFHMFDYIGGRYSVSSSVGGVPISIAYGYENFEKFLKGAEEMDNHAKNAPVEKNIPIIAALISIWNNNYLGYNTQAIIPYSTPLRKLVPHIQQLYMESNGKSITKNNEILKKKSGVIIFGDIGTNAQHSFFQLAHQGQAFPIDFIGVIKPMVEQLYNKNDVYTNHQALWVNLLSQISALAIGKKDNNKYNTFPGNRPSSIISINDLSPINIGRLLSFYEAKTIFEAFILDINPFDQFGVELGKSFSNDLLKEIILKNKNKNYTFQKTNETSQYYLNTIFKGKI